MSNGDPFLCANAECRVPLERDHVTLITTCHLRRFCSVECIADGQRAHLAAIRAMTDEEMGFIDIPEWVDHGPDGAPTTEEST